RPSVVRISGLISTRSASPSTYARYSFTSTSTVPSVAAGFSLAPPTPPPAADGPAQAAPRVHVQAGDRLGRLFRHLLDVDAPARGQQPEVQLRRSVERERRVVLLGDVARPLDPQRPDDVSPDVHAEDVLGVGADGVGVGRELDAAGLAAPAHGHPGPGE